MSAVIRSVAVIGAGTMGPGIAQVAAQAGLETRLFDLDPTALEAALERVRASLGKGVERGKLTEEASERAQKNLRLEGQLSSAVHGVELVIEAVREDLAVKQELFRTVEQQVGEETLLATNTSSLPIAQIARALGRPERLVGMHFFNPVPIMKLIEVVVCEQTADWARDRALEIGRRMGKDPILVNDSPGFASSRLAVVLGLEAMRMLEQNVASTEDIDKAMELGYRHPMGPLKLTDLIGLDVRLAIAETLFRELGGETYRPPEILRRKVAAGELGRKSGQGFYTW